MPLLGKPAFRDRPPIFGSNAGTASACRDDPALDLALFCLTVAIARHRRAPGALIAQ